MSSKHIKQMLFDVEPSFLNLTASSARTPDNTALAHVGFPVANPEIVADIATSENEYTRDRWYKRAPNVLTHMGSVNFDMYLRAADQSGAEDEQFWILDAFFGIRDESIEVVSAAGIPTWASDVSVTLGIGEAAAVAIGQGISTVIDGVAYVAFITDIAADVLTLHGAGIPGASLLTADYAINGGVTYAIGRDFIAGTSLAVQLLSEDFLAEAFGCQGSTMEIPLETGEMATLKCSLAAGYVIPTAAAVAPSSSVEPIGAWLKFLNGDCFVGATTTGVRSVTWNLDFSPKKVPTPANAAGLSRWEMGLPTISAEMVLSDYDSGTMFSNFTAGTSVAILCSLGAGVASSACGIFAPAMVITEAPIPGEEDDLTTLPIKLEAGLYIGDGTAGTDEYDNTNVIDTVFRLFISIPS